MRPLVVLLALLAAACGGRDEPDILGCPTPEWPGPWTACAEARWVEQVVEAAGYEVTGDTGSALTAEGRGRRFDVWAASTGAGDTEPADDGSRTSWSAQGFTFWVSAGPRSTDEKPSLAELAGLVRASRELSPPPAEQAEPSARRFSERGVSFRLPPRMDVTGFSATVFPRRLVAATYPVSRDDVEGDCGGLAAVQRLPDRGAYLVLIDYGGGAATAPALRREFPQSLPLELEDGRLADFSCFGRSYAFRFLVGDRALQVHIGFGPDADGSLRATAIALLNSVRVLHGP